MNRDENDDLAWIKVDNGRGRKTDSKGGKGCLVLIWAGAVLLLAACAGWVVNIWRDAVG